MSGLLIVAFHGSSTDAAPPVDVKNGEKRFLHYSNAQYFIVITRRSLSVPPPENISGALAANGHLHMDDTHSPPLQSSQLSSDTAGNVAVITVDTVSGQLLHVGIPEFDIFANIDDALRAIPALCSTGIRLPSVQVVSTFVALAGACLTDDAIHILFVEKHEELASLWEVPVYAAVQAQWYSIPLRVAVSALQPAEWKSPASGVATLPSLAGWVGEKICLYYSPGLDITHCDAFTAAVRRAASGHMWGPVKPEDSEYREETTYSAGDTMLRWGILPTVSAQSVRDAMGRYDCLWNEELIAFCELFGLGSWCCRLALGSCTTTSRELHGSQAILLVRLSRLAFSGCMGDNYVSPMETEFQLMLTSQRSTDSANKNERDMMNGQRGNAPKEEEGNISNKEVVNRSNGEEGDASSGPEGNAAKDDEENISSEDGVNISNEEVGDACSGQEGNISSEEVGNISNKEEGDASSGQEGNAPKEEEDNISNTEVVNRSNGEEGDASSGQEGNASKEEEENLSSEDEVNISSEEMGDVCSGLDGNAPKEEEENIASEDKVNISSEDEVNISNGEVGDASSGQEGNISSEDWDLPNGQGGNMSNEDWDLLNGQEGNISSEDWDAPNGQERVEASEIPSSDLGAASFFECGVFSVVWRRGSDFADHPDLSAQRQRFANYALRFVDPIPPWEDCVASVFAAYLERYGPGTRIALVHACEADKSTSGALSALAAHIRAHALRPPVTVGTAVPPRSVPLVPPPRAPAFVERCVLRVCVTDANMTTTPETMVAWLDEVLHVGAPVVEAARTLLTASAALTCGLAPAELIAFTTALFPRGDHFVARASAQHRTTLLSHPARLAAVVDAQLLAPSAHDSEHTTRFSFLPTHLLHHSSSFLCERASARASANGYKCEMDLGASLRAAVHPSAPALRLPPSATSVELTIALPALAHVTHIALSIAGAVQEAPYAAPLALSLTACCYVGQPHERVVFEDLPLPLSLNGPVACAEPRLIFFALPRYCKSDDKRSTGGLFDTIEYADASLGFSGVGFDDTSPVIARFLRVELRGSGAHAMAVPPLFIFGELVDDIPPSARDAVFGRHTALRRNLRVGESRWKCVSTTNNDTVTPPQQQPHEVYHGMYTHNISNLFPARLYYVSLELAFVMETKRRQCGARRCNREICLRRVGTPRWLLNPALHLLPLSVFHRSQLPADYATANTVPSAKGTARTTGKRCALCGQGFSWRCRSCECVRCKCSMCDKCIVNGRVWLVELGNREANAALCPPCHAQATRLESAYEDFLLSHSKDNEAVVGVVPSEALKQQKKEEEEEEEEVSIDFYARYAVPRLAETLRGFPPGRAYSRGPCALLTAYPHTRVVSAPGMHDPHAPLFEDALPLAGHTVHVNARWRCVAPDEWTKSATCLQRRVVLLLPHDAHVQRGILRFSLDAPCIDVSVDIQLHVGATLQGLRMRASGCVSCRTKGKEEEKEKEEGEEREECELVLDCASDGVHAPARVVALVFAGTTADLARLCVASFAAWGAFAPLRECPETPLREYVAKLSAMRYAMRFSSGTHSSAHAPLCAGCLPRMLFMTRLIPLRAVTTHSRAEQLTFLVEFDFGMPATICGFTLEQHHPAFAAATHNAIATALRFIGVSAAGCRGNMAYVQLPWPPLTKADTGAPEALALAYALPLPNHNIASVMVEVVEWRLAKASDGEKECDEEGLNRRSIYLGRICFWTSINANTRRVVSSGSYASIHTSAE